MGTERGKVFKSLRKQVSDINTQRNGVAHRGEFKIKKTSRRVIEEARSVIEVLVQEYDKSFTLSMPDEYLEDENP